MTVCSVWASALLTQVSNSSVPSDKCTDTCLVEPKAQTTFFDTVKSQLDAPLFAVTLKHQAPGSYDFGFIDHSKYTGDLTYADVDSSQGFWMFDAKAGLSDFTAIAGMFKVPSVNARIF